MRAASLGDEDAAYLMAEAPSMRPRRWFGREAEMRLSAEETYERPTPRTFDAALRELGELMRRMSPEDVERLLDLARRFTR